MARELLCEIRRAGAASGSGLRFELGSHEGRPVVVVSHFPSGRAVGLLASELTAAIVALERARQRIETLEAQAGDAKAPGRPPSPAGDEPETLGQAGSLLLPGLGG